LAGRWGADFQQSMLDSRLEKEGFIRSGRVLDFWKRRSASGEVPNQLWYLFVLETWLRNEESRPAVRLQEQWSGV
jgi:hypothetical protein